MNEAFKKSVRRITYTVTYCADLCRWFVDALESIPDYNPEAKTVKADFQDTEKTGT